MQKFHSLILRSCLLIFVLVDYSRQATIKVNETQNTYETRNHGAICNPESECVVISRCNTNDLFPDTWIFPCGSENGGTLLVCCPIEKASALKQTTEAPTTPSTASVSPKAIAPKTTAPNNFEMNISAALINKHFRHTYLWAKL
ncbi:uncharacterized protein LOC143921659 [Arctopsyche grandis]|uniref:uncharacterized protein LOC143921659 n=1 Tax=Arctopsyche grandis TaxID=121162 RepID=UPI00406D6DA5